MTKPFACDLIYGGRRFEAEIIELCVRWYITYRLSYRDLVAMMAERGLPVSHTTILRWVIRYVPGFEKRWSRRARKVHSSWRVDETYISVRGKWHYLYRAVDKRGKTVDFLLRPDRGIAAAQAFFRKAWASSLPRWPRKITLDGHAPSHQALRLLRREDPRWKYVLVRKCPYLNNIVEQDHRAIKRRCASMLGFKSFVQGVVRDSGTQQPRDEGWLGASTRCTVTSMEASLALVEAGLAYAWLPAHLVEDGLQRGALRALPLDAGRTRNVSLSLVLVRPDCAGPAARAAVECFQRHVPVTRLPVTT